MTFLKAFYHFSLAWLGSVIYRHPSRELFVVGITGTKGKSTVAELINAILEADHKKTAVLSSVRLKVGNASESNPTSNTMPGRFAIQRFLRRAADAGCAYAIIEVTSQGVLQYRHRFIDFDAALFLNLHPEHIESHGSFEAYRSAKVRFFTDVAKRSEKPAKFFIINADDPERDHFFNAVHGFGEVQYFSREQFTAHWLGGATDGLGAWFKTPFNMANAAAAYAFAQSRGISWETVRRALAGFAGVPGRMEVVQSRPFTVVVDYAHTPDSLRLVYESLIGTPKGVGGRRGRLLCVLGSAGGGRDAWKRPVFGQLASRWCDRVFLTDEDPYDEDPHAIIGHIASGIDHHALPTDCLLKIADREKAIIAALREAHPGDTVIITGKGSERSIHRADGVQQAWSDRDAVKTALRTIDKKR